MLKCAFIGTKNSFDLIIIDWLSRRTDVKFCLWTNKIAWCYSGGKDRPQRVAKFFCKRIGKIGFLKVVNEALYFVFYIIFLKKGSALKLENLVSDYWHKNKTAKFTYKEIFVEDINSDDLVQLIKENSIDVIFTMCIDVKIPRKLYSAPRLGTFLWHEGIVPEYRGLYSPFWALYNLDYRKIGYTLIKINDNFDEGAIFVQGPVKDINPTKDLWGYIGHKAIYDSLPQVEIFLKQLENFETKEIIRENAVEKYYSRPGLTHLLLLLTRRLMRRNTGSNPKGTHLNKNSENSGKF